MLRGMWAGQLVFLSREHLSHPCFGMVSLLELKKFGWETTGAGLGVLEPGAPGVPAGDISVSPINH